MRSTPPILAEESEAQFQATVSELAKLAGWEVHHHYDSRRSEPGWPDLVLCRPPELLIVELKRDRGRVSDRQRAWLRMLSECGIEIHVWRPKDWKTVESRLTSARASRESSNRAMVSKP